MYAAVTAGAIEGMDSYLAEVEVDCSRGLPGFDMVGLLGHEVRESRERIKVALKNLKFELPPIRITVNISPADRHKDGTSYDLPVAIGILAAMELIPKDYLEGTMLAGELGLKGEIRPVRGILPMLLEARRAGYNLCIIPKDNMAEARLVPGLHCEGAADLEEAIGLIGSGGHRIIYTLEAEPCENLKQAEVSAPDFRLVRGQEEAKRAALTAAAGFHHLLLTGPPGVGKSMIAECLPGILPPLTQEEELEVAAVYSVAGKAETYLGSCRRPYVHPHHTMTAASLVGGGTIPMPGAVSLAHKGVLFLDELTEFPAYLLNLLRQPLEERQVFVARSRGNYRFPADFMLVGAMNPCPCGYYPDRSLCTCSPVQVERYQAKISGPILDRIDIRTVVRRVDFDGLFERERQSIGMTTAQMRDRVEAARERQMRRFKGTNTIFNAQMNAEAVAEHCKLSNANERYLKQLYEGLHLSARGCHKLLKVARTLADLDEQEQISQVHLSEACSLHAEELHQGMGGYGKL